MTEQEKIEEQIFLAVEDNDSIVVFGHKNPDGDCLGSVQGLKEALREYYPKKRIYSVGTYPSYIGAFAGKDDEVTDDIIRNSLAFMVDLSDLERVEDQRIHMAKSIVCIDHHMQNNILPFPVYRNDKAPSATFIIASLLYKRFKEISPLTATYLYLGLVTDSGRFQFDSEPATFAIAAKLVKSGAKYKEIYRELYKQSSIDLKYRSFIYQNFQFDGLVTYCVVHKEDYKALGLDQNDASGKVNLLSMLDGHPIWAFFIEQDNGVIRVELRSDGTKNVQKVATAFGGGGHIPAAGCRLTDFADVSKVVAALNLAEEVK